MRKAEIKYNDITAGWLVEDDEGYHFTYDALYFEAEEQPSVSLTLPKQKAEFKSISLFPFFDGLIPEGWLLDIAEKNWKLNPRDRMGLLMACCKDCIGAVSVYPVNQEE
jgi:serine/threonine-protein kinase HipA